MVKKGYSGGFFASTWWLWSVYKRQGLSQIFGWQEVADGEHLTQHFTHVVNLVCLCMNDAAAIALQRVVVDIPFHLTGQTREECAIMVIAKSLKKSPVELSACRCPR